jgi:hypothetical protein
MSEFEKFEKKELSQEILNEWYHEKGIFLTEKERDELKNREEVATAEFKPSYATKTTADLKKEEEEKKIIVKNRIKLLLALGEKKGLEYSINEVKKENDPFLLDLYHDVLAKDGAFKKFLSK